MENTIQSEVTLPCTPSDAFKMVEFIRRYNRWRRGDESLEMESPKAIGDALDAVCSFIETLEREQDEWVAKAVELCAERESNAMQALAYKAERDEARAMARDMRNQLEKGSPARLLFPWENASAMAAADTKTPPKKPTL